MARAPLARPTDAPPIAHEPADGVAVTTPTEAPVEPLLPPEELPRHVAIIMDGNRRWARQRDVSELEGHAAGVEAIRNLLRHAVRRGVPVLTLYAFSRENWARSDEEVVGLFGLLEGAIRDETAELRAEGVRVRLLGRVDELPPETRRSIEGALDETSGGARLLLNIAFNYAGRTELVDAFRRLAASGIAADEIDEQAISDALYTGGLPDPDLVIRTGGEQRLSNFLIWQSAYAELYSSVVLWPDFGPAEFDAALVEFARRTRRFGARPAPGMLRDRAFGSAIVVGSLGVAIIIGAPGIAILVGILVILGAIEAFSLLRGAGYPVLVGLGLALALAVALAIAVTLDATTYPRLAGGSLVLASVGIVLVGIGAFGRQDARDGLATWVATVFGALYVSALAFVVRLGQVGPPIPTEAVLSFLGAERGWILLLVLGVWSYDTGAFLVGRQWGRQFLTHLSPSKTLEGLLGGTVATTLVVLAGLWGLGQPPIHALVLGPLLALAAQAGDLAELMLKRAAGAKDSSHIIPGHGGVLDRIDSFLFAAPVVTLYVLALLG